MYETQPGIQVQDNWTRQQTLALISELKNHPCLYNPLDKHFSNRAKRNEQYNIILEALKRIRPHVKLSDIKKKIRTLQSQLSKERSRIKRSKRSVSSDVVIPSLWCYNNLTFLIQSNDLKLATSPNLEFCDVGMDSEITQNIEEVDERSSDSGSRGQILIDSEMYENAEEAEERGSDSGEEIKNYKNDYQSTAFEGLNCTKHCADTRPKTLSKEEEFCNYLCTELKQIKLDSNFRQLKLEILMLVDKKIEEESKITEVNRQLMRGLVGYGNKIRSRE